MVILQVKKLLAVCALLVLTLSFCEAKNATVKLVGLLHCTDCFNNHSSSSNSSLGFDVFITCNARKNETKTQGNGGVDKQGKFNVTLEEDATEIDGCYAKLQSNSGAPCHIQEPQTASVKVLSNGEKEEETIHQPTVIKFSPLTCQSAFFWPFPNLTFFGSSPPSPPEYIPPPSPENLPPVNSPVQPPENSSPPPQPSDDPPLPPPEIEAPSPPPSADPPAAAPPTYQNTTDPEIGSPSSPPQASTTLPVNGTPPPLPPPSSPPSPPPPVNRPSQSPTPPTTVIAPASPAISSSPPPPLPSPENPVTPPPAATVPGRRRPSPIPKAPPIPRLPLTPSIPRKYFNAPNSKSKPPHTV